MTLILHDVTFTLPFKGEAHCIIMKGNKEMFQPNDVTVDRQTKEESSMGNNLLDNVATCIWKPSLNITLTLSLHVHCNKYLPSTTMWQREKEDGNMSFYNGYCMLYYLPNFWIQNNQQNFNIYSVLMIWKIYRRKLFPYVLNQLTGKRIHIKYDLSA